MTSEHGFWPQEVHAPVDETDSIPRGAAEQPESSYQQDSLYNEPNHLTKSDKSFNVDTQTNFDKAKSYEAFAVGREDFDWHTDLSENAKKLFLLILYEVGWTQSLSELSKSEKIDLEAGLQELRQQELIDESDPAIVTVLKRYL